jgi:hypothetical protein
VLPVVLGLDPNFDSTSMGAGLGSAPWSFPTTIIDLTMDEENLEDMALHSVINLTIDEEDPKMPSISHVRGVETRKDYNADSTVQAAAEELQITDSPAKPRPSKDKLFISIDSPQVGLKRPHVVNESNRGEADFLERPRKRPKQDNTEKILKEPHFSRQ